MVFGFSWTGGWQDGNLLHEKVCSDDVDDGAGDESDSLWPCAEAVRAC